MLVRQVNPEFIKIKGWRSSGVEQLICNQPVGGSNPFASSLFDEDAGEVAEWTKAADCKSAGESLRRFESCPPQKFRAGVAQLARASAFQAEGRGFEPRLPLVFRDAHVAQSVEHVLGKDEVGGSSPLVGLIFNGMQNIREDRRSTSNVKGEV